MPDWQADEFRITASKPNEKDRVWTRSRYGAAKTVAEGAVVKLGYVVAKVINTFGGDLSDPLYVVEAIGTHSPPRITDHVENERAAR
jgi:hypothetical protein